MCCRFAQVQTRADYLDVFASDLEFTDSLDNVPIARYNVAPDTSVLILNHHMLLNLLSGIQPIVLLLAVTHEW